MVTCGWLANALKFRYDSVEWRYSQQVLPKIFMDWPHFGSSGNADERMRMKKNKLQYWLAWIKWQNFILVCPSLIKLKHYIVHISGVDIDLPSLCYLTNKQWLSVHFWPLLMPKLIWWLWGGLLMTSTIYFFFLTKKSSQSQLKWISSPSPFSPTS